ncbi:MULTISPECIES: DUF262 domain-containing protein [Helicobacter]|uniref:GmrSD restriction endonucleases N-terminal domain-containing protein n=1 Tax=Helicobacter bilis ATCC 43879 TaxID=613026 RepID=C3XII2_9HELI|nr:MULTISPECIES: DUF262 domain-containing protein [Helicobacter]EEO24800.1 hypothetical protein HRAG_01857 [Helicobacter bilis ATCC 43879]
MVKHDDIKTIKELLLTDKTRYHIPSYQRGYKWKKQQVEALLNDLYEFALQEKAKFYCLQPIMLKENKGKYNVIDGQQRLTTLYLICKVLDLGIKCTIEYDTRKKSTEFLKDPEKYMDSQKVDSSDKNIFKGMDYYFMIAAYKTIKEWLGNNNEKKEVIKGLFQADKTEKYVGMIWYKSDENEAYLFANINSGKIPLNDAELIKAQLLLKDEANKIQELRQIECANEWDSMEYALQDDEFFSFLVEDKESYDTRILLLFEVYYEIYSDSEKDKSHAVFEFIQTKLMDKNSKECCWQEIKKIFLTFKSWYNNSKSYHLIGFLLVENESLAGLYKEAQGQTKSKFLHETIKEKVKEKIATHNKKDLANIKSLTYGDNNKELKSIVLLFNMLSYIDTQYRFSFDIYKNNDWELEHIHAQQDKTPQIPFKEVVKWLRDSKQILKNAEQSGKESSIDFGKIPSTLERVESLLEKLKAEAKKKKLDDDETKEFGECVKAVFEIFKGDELHTIGNLTLLSKNENISLGNAIFAMKQQRIKEKEQEGAFIPLCTRNVFLKYYTKEQNISQALFWSKQDSQDYQEEIIAKIQKYLFS